MRNPMKRIFTWGKKIVVENGAESASALKDIDAETLEIARELAYERKIKKAASAKWRPNKKGVVSDDEILDALRTMTPSQSQIMRKVFARTVEDTVLANRFTDPSGQTHKHLTLKKAVAMDGLRDIDDNVDVSSAVAGTMNPEGRFNVPLHSGANHEFAQRFNEAMNPVRSGRISGAIPDLILDHFANFSTFIGYPAAEVIACHPTVSNACTIPGEDAIAPGYTLAFLDSEDVNDNGVPDVLEVAELGGVKRSLGRIASMEALKDAIVTLSAEGGGNASSNATGASLDALALALERLAAYEEWERTAGAGENAAQAVNEGFVQPVSQAFSQYVNKPDDAKSQKDAIAALSFALADLAKKEHPVLDEVRATKQRRDTVVAVKVAVETLSKPEEEWDQVKSLNDLAVAVERVAAYEKFSDRNAESMAALNMALIDFSQRQEPEVRQNAVQVLQRTVAAMDADEFDFTDPNGVQQPQPQPSQPQLDPYYLQQQAELQAQREAEHAQVLEQERLEDRQTKAALAAHNAEAKEGRINDLHKQKMDFLAQQNAAKQKAAEALAGLKGKSAEAQENRAAEAHQQKMAIAQRMADQKLQQQQQQFEANQQQAQLAQQQALAQQQQALEQQQAAAESKKKMDEKQEKTKVAARVAKERQKILDQWKQRADAMGINEVCTRLARNARVFGIGIAVPVVDGVDYEQPMDFDKIREGSYHGFTVIEPTWIYPEVDSDDLINPMSPSFFEPKYWAATGSSSIGSLSIRRIHRSWMIIVRNKEVPNMLRPMYYYGGLSLCQEIYEAVFCADKVMNEVPKLAMTKRTTVVKGDPNDLITNPEGVVERLGAYSQVQDNFGLLFVGRTADVQKLETSLSEFDQLIAKCNQRIAAIAQMPESKLFKAQLGGAFQTGVYEMRDYWSLLMRIQNNWFKPLIQMHYRLDTMSRIGKVVDLKVEFNPVDVPTNSEEDESQSRMVQTLNSAIQAQWIAPSEARSIARSREGSMFSAISAELPEELVQAQQQQGQPGGGMPGGGGMPEMPGMAPTDGGEGGEGSDGGEMPKQPEMPDAPSNPMAMPEVKEAKEPQEPKTNIKSPAVGKIHG